MNLLNNNSENIQFPEVLADDEKIISILERGALKDLGSCISEDYVETKILEFLNCFNSSYRLTFSHCSSQNKEKFIYLLSLLRRSAKKAHHELRQNSNKKHYSFRCIQCEKTLTIERYRNVWKTLQDHNHFEKTYIDSLKDENVALISEQFEYNNLNEKETIHESVRLGIQNVPIIEKSSNNNDEIVNSFRFNFQVKYEDKIASLMYPRNLIKAIQAYEQIKNYTVQCCGPLNVFCLICLHQITCFKVTRHTLIKHILGRKHFKLCLNKQVVERLENYHKFWLQQDECIQSHQVYVKPHNKASFRCTICFKDVAITSVIEHIMGYEHREKVMHLYNTKNEEFYLMDIQVICYGIVEDKKQIEESPQEMSNEEFKDLKKRENIVNLSPDNHNIIRSIEKPESVNVFDLIPNRMKNQLSYFKQSKDNQSIYCTLCKCNIPFQLGCIKKHILMASCHANSQKKFKYYCEICDMWCQSEFDWSEHNFNGRRHKIMPEARKAKVTEYECTTCNMIIFGDELSISRHLPRNLRLSKKDRAKKLPEIVKLLFKSRESIAEHAKELVSESENVTLIDSRTALCYKDLQDVLLEKFKDCKLFPYGSRMSGTGNDKSDLDVFVDVGNQYKGLYKQEPIDQVIFIKEASKLFAKNQNYTNLNSILTARIPILTLHHIPTKINCDLSFKHGLSVENTKFLKYCMKLQPIIKPFVLIIKKWLGNVAVDNITNYALTIMGIFFLQYKGFLPSVNKIMEIQGVGHIISGWKTIAYNSPLTETKKYIKECTLPLDVLLKEFFEYYYTFNYGKYVICPFLGHVLLKTLFSENAGRDLPRELDNYKTKSNMEDGEVFKMTAFMCIQDPFDLSHNLTKSIQLGNLQIFTNMCKLTSNLLDFSA
ncbi:uncharacterized protein LOC143194465 isoform X1 [Rhynchophorus ferrugineus]|uniref:uncharacterized protein LOC143194465 isoform X1 n=1 Tax=Rhynchophorus ferrugineus TaxID=354439 RepID=UPI003FCE4885